MLNNKIEKAGEVISSTAGSEICVCWTGGGKDSVVLLHLVESAVSFKPFLLFIDSGTEFEETYTILDKYRSSYHVHIETARMADEFQNNPNAQCSCTEGKIQAIQRAVFYYDISCLAIGIRWDEHPAREKEFYTRQCPTYKRIHPILHFTEQDIWDYIKLYNLEVNPLYERGYRSLGCFRCTSMAKEGERERAGRATEKEGLMANLRARGYF